VDRLERAVGFPLPRGYREYLTRLGHGYLNNWLMVYLPGPGMVEQQREYVANLFPNYHYFEYTGPKLSQADIDACVILGYTLDGQDVLACPRFPGWAFVIFWGGHIHGVKTGFERVDRLHPAGFSTGRFMFFEPNHADYLQRRFACPLKVAPADLEAFFGERRASAPDHVWRNSEGQTAELWLFIKALRARLVLYQRDRTYLEARIHKDRLPNLLVRLQDAGERFGVRFKPSRG
jgi:hypothetical protein